MSETTCPDLSRVRALAPRAAAAFDQSRRLARVALGPEQYGAIRARVWSRLRGRDVGLNPVLDPSVGRLVDQFVDYVPDVTEDHLEPLRDSLGDRRLRELVESIYVIDQVARLEVTHSALLDAASPGWPVAEEPEARAISRANLILHDALLAEPGLDPVTREIVRSRAGQYHCCGVCNSLRLVVDGVPVIGPDVASAVAEYRTADFTERHQAALAYADAHMADPVGIGRSLRATLRELFSQRELLQLSLEVSAWNYQKVLVALGMDAPLSDEGLTAMTIDSAGEMHLGSVIVSVAS